MNYYSCYQFYKDFQELGIEGLTIQTLQELDME